MKVYLVQHAEAKPEEVDPDRPLSAKGRDDIEAVAAQAAQMNLTVAEIRHSGKLRAQQTAEILGAALKPDQGVNQASGLGPVDDVHPAAEALDSASAPLVLVGHLPFMARMAGLLVAGNADFPVVKIQNAALICLEKAEQGWQVSWILTPEMATC